MNQQVLEKVDGYIKAMAESLGVASEYVFRTLVHQMFVEGIVFSAVFIISVLVASLILYKGVKVAINKWDEIYKNDIEVPIVCVMVLACIGYIILIIATVNELPQNLMKIFNPEYYALKEILAVFKK